MMMHSRRRSKHSEAGMVSMLVTIVLMLVISIIVLSFAQISRREQRQSLDRQLSEQAFLAAESAVNDARKVILENLNKGENIEKTRCGDDPAAPIYDSLNPDLDAANNVRYTCLLVTSKLNNIKVTLNIDSNAVTVPIHPGAGTVDTLHIKWTPKKDPATVTTAGCAANVPSPLPKATNWPCDFGMLRMDIVPTDSLDRAGLLDKQKAAFLYPTTGSAGTLAYASAKGAVAGMRCANDGCTMDITGLSGFTNYALRLLPLYEGGNVEITADGSAGPNIELKDVQVQVDATGRAQDVLRRIQVRLPLIPDGGNADYALQSASSICKRFRITDSMFMVDGDIRGQDRNNPMCEPQSYADVTPSNPPVLSRCVYYAMHDEGEAEAQLITIDPQSNEIRKLGLLQSNYDMEGIDLDPKPDTPGDFLYGFTGEQSSDPGRLYRIDTKTGLYTLIGDTGLSGDHQGVSFKADGSLWVWVFPRGLYEVDKRTGKATLRFSEDQNIEGISWNPAGTVLYGSDGARLFAYTPATGKFEVIASNLIDPTEGLETRPDGRLLGGRGTGSVLNIFLYDVTTKSRANIEIIDTRYYDIESIAYPDDCPIY